MTELAAVPAKEADRSSDVRNKELFGLCRIHSAQSILSRSPSDSPNAFLSLADPPRTPFSNNLVHTI
jgi:hypothetical protein